MATLNDALSRLQDWYAAQCDGTWEHSYGIEIGTLDNPGRLLKVDLRGTRLETAHFDEVRAGMSTENEADWMHLRVEDHVFVGAGGACKLADCVEAFLDGAARH